jgi:hypothetical protein
MALGRFRLGLVGQAHRLAGRRDAANHEALVVGVVEDDLAGLEQLADQVALAQRLVVDALHHVRMGGVVDLLEHGLLRQAGTGVTGSWSSL